MFAAKFPISQNPHGILYVYYTIIFLRVVINVLTKVKQQKDNKCAHF